MKAGNLARESSAIQMHLLLLVWNPDIGRNGLWEEIDPDGAQYVPHFDICGHCKEKKSVLHADKKWGGWLCWECRKELSARAYLRECGGHYSLFHVWCLPFCSAL